jgi:hypothetical protein
MATIYTEEKKEVVVASPELRQKFIEVIRRKLKREPLIADNFRGATFVRLNRVVKDDVESSVWVSHVVDILAEVTVKGANPEDWEAYLLRIRM